MRIKKQKPLHKLARRLMDHAFENSPGDTAESDGWKFIANVWTVPEIDEILKHNQCRSIESAIAIFEDINRYVIARLRDSDYQEEMLSKPEERQVA